MPSTHLLRKKNEIYKNRSAKHTVAKAAEKSKVTSKASYPYWAIALCCFALFGGIIFQLVDTLL